jgi:tRNA pseudouridine55 synthase
MATGLLIMGVGRATRLLRFLGDLPKGYRGTALLGVETTTLDADGEILRRTDPSAVTEARIRHAMADLIGDVEQMPPAYSAVKVGGIPLHRAARRGEPLEAPPRIVHVRSFDLIGSAGPRFDFEVTCSGGTYVRSLAADLGASLGCGAHLTALRRVTIGPFEVDDGVSPEDPGAPLPVVTAVDHLPGLTLDAEEARVAAHGSVLGPADIVGPYRVHGPDGRLIGIYRDHGAKAVPEMILGGEDGP